MDRPCCWDGCRIPPPPCAFRLPSRSEQARVQPNIQWLLFCGGCDCSTILTTGAPCHRSLFLTCFRLPFCYKNHRGKRSKPFVKTSAICRGSRSCRLLAYASPRENLMIRTLKAVSAPCLVLMLAAICFGQGGVATGD